MTCWTIRNKLPGYLDGALASREHKPISEHLDFCADCRRDLERYRKLSMLMGRVERVAPPADLAVRIRVSASLVRNRKTFWRRAWDTAALLLENILEPVAVPATGGVMATMLVFALVLQNLFIGVPVGAVPNDVPTNLTQPARLQSLSPFPMANGESMDGPGATLLMIEARVNDKGEAIGYDILVGPDNASVRKQLDHMMLFTRFRPQMSFGRPVPGGRVVLSFSEIRVRG
ncbi:MAG TPA: anti-sigma factor [Candidatus Acidoferrales bacterium]|jgi:hypothetical protein|nr:anti-sigma factor [Candidatus Acidoferrales bacterium]